MHYLHLTAPTFEGCEIQLIYARSWFLHGYVEIKRITMFHSSSAIVQPIHVLLRNMNDHVCVAFVRYIILTLAEIFAKRLIKSKIT